MAAPPASVVVITLVSAALVNGFNLDTEMYTRYRGEPNSMFGFSVALHREAGTSWVLVGSPKAETRQPGVSRAGAVYACDIGKDDHCSQIPFDLTGHNNSTSGEQMDEKNSQWFGASVYSAGEGGPVVACAPMYIFYSTVPSSRRDPVGTCFLARNVFREFSEYSPCRTRDWGYHRQGSCQAGLGVSISRDGERLFIGAVGSRYWQGMVISQNTHRRPDVLSTNEGPYTEDDSYMGYSITVGDFGGTVAGHEDVAVGRPRGAKLLGQVLLYTWNLTNIHNITGEQLGSYFGYSMTTSDVDGDGRDDLIIGAPLYTDLENNEGKYETGRVYIMYQGTGPVRFNQLHIKDGKNSKGRFGLALTTLGDINKDGYGDFAVGAPYDGPDERGAVYLFHGGKEGVRDTHSQVIYAEDVVGSPSTFGFSLSGGRDLDENDYPDMVVGAYDSNTAVFLRARPVVKVQANINFLSEGKQIALEERNCTLRDRTKVPCIQVNSCLKYDGVGVERRLDFEVQFVLDSKKQRSPRLFFLSDEGRNIMNQSLRLNKGQETCKSMFVYLKPNVRDKLTTLDAEIRYSLMGNYSNTRRLSRQLSPILDLNEELSRKDSITIRKNCGKDNICIPDLRLIAQPSVKRYLLGSGERFHLIILVENEGEDAFEASFDTSIPPGMNYVKIERMDDAEKEIPVQCSPPAFINNNTLHCDIGNPLPREKLVQFKVILQPFHQDGMKPRYEFEMRVNSTNPENGTTTSDNLKHITIPIWVETDLILQGSSHPADVYYNSSLYYKTDNFTYENEIGPQVIHVYGIRNKGPSDIVEAEAYFLWPSYTLAGDHLLYLLEQPETLGNMKCDYVEETNVEQLMLDRKRKPFLDHHGELGIQAGLTRTESSETSSSSSFSSSSGSSRNSVHETRHSSTSSSSSHSTGVLTAEERRRLEEASRRREEEEALKETGDSSDRHGQRNRNKMTEVHYSSNGGRLESDSHSKSVVIDERGRVEVSKIPVHSDKSYFEQSSRGSHSSGSRHSDTSSFGSGSHNRGMHTHYEEKEVTSNTTWNSREPPITVTSTKWKTVDDGDEKSGSSSNVHRGAGNINLANLGLSSAGNRRYTIGGMGGGRTFSEETNYEKNTTWDSRERKPHVSESSNWKTNEDGVIKSGSSRSSSSGSDRRVTAGESTSEYDRRTSMTGSGTYQSGSRHGSVSTHDQFGRGTVSTGSSQERHGTRIHEEDIRENSNWNSNNRNMGRDNDRRTSYSSGHHHSSAGGHGSSHRTFSGMENEGDVNYGGAGTTYTDSRHTSESRGHSRAEGSALRESALDDRISESSGRRTDGRHRVHWSSEQSSGSNTHVEGTRNYQGSEQNSGSSTHLGGRGEYRGSGQSSGSSTHLEVAGEHRDSEQSSGSSTHLDGTGNYRGFEQSSRSNTHLEGTGDYRGTANVEGDIRRLVGTSGTVQSNGSRDKTITKEHSHEWNTTWSSADGGKPKTTEYTRWSVNEGGVVTNGSYSDTYEGRAKIDKDLNKHLLVTNVESGGLNIDQNLVKTGNRGTVYSEEKETTYNTTWSSATGGRPLTRQETNWKVNRDGVVTSGSKSDIFEGTPPSIDVPQDHRSGIHGSRRQGYSQGSRHEERGHRAESGGYVESRHTGHASGGHAVHHHGVSSSGVSAGERRRHEDGSFGSEGGEHHESSHQAGTTNIRDLLKGSQSSGGQASSFDHFGEVARGPNDGVAKTYTLDLGINTGNTPGEVGTSRHRAHSTHYSSSTGDGESRGRHYSSSDLRDSSLRNEDSQGHSYRNQDRIESYNSGGGRSHSSWSHSTSGVADGDNPQHGGSYGIREVSESSYHKHVSDDSNKGKFQLYPRYKRQAGEEDLAKSLDCGPTDCIKIRCTLGPLKKDEEAWVAFRSRVWVPTIRKLSTNVEVGLSSLVAARVTRLPHIGSPDVVNTHTHEVHSQIMPPDVPVKPDIIPLWIVVVAACAGAIILMLLVYLLYKCGFFKRNRPSNAPEKQPLNRNGYHHGDEAL